MIAFERVRVVISARISNLERQLDESQSECRHLRQQLSTLEKRSNPPRLHTAVANEVATDGGGSEHRTLSKDSVAVASHMQQLNDVIGNLRIEKLELTTQLRKQQLRIAHLENLADQLSRQVSP